MDKIKNHAVVTINAAMTGGRELTKNIILKTMETVRTPIEAWMRNQIEQNIRKVLKILKPVAKEAIKEEDMFDWVKKIVDDFIEELWPEIEEEVIYVLRFKYDQPPEYVPNRALYCYERN